MSPSSTCGGNVMAQQLSPDGVSMQLRLFGFSGKKAGPSAIRASDPHSKLTEQQAGRIIRTYLADWTERSPTVNVPEFFRVPISGCVPPRESLQICCQLGIAAKTHD